MKKKSSRVRVKKNTKSDLISLFLLFVFIILFIVSFIKVFIYVKNGNEDKKVFENISKDIVVEEPSEEGDDATYKIDFNSLKEKNPDTVRVFKSKWYRYCSYCC